MNAVMTWVLGLVVLLGVVPELKRIATALEKQTETACKVPNVRTDNPAIVRTDSRPLP